MVMPILEKRKLRPTEVRNLLAIAQLEKRHGSSDLRTGMELLYYAVNRTKRQSSGRAGEDQL